MAKNDRVQVVPGLVVAEHEEWDQDCPSQNQPWQHLTGGTWHLEPGGGLSPAEVRSAVQEEAGQWHKVGGGPGAARVLVHRLNPRRHGWEDYDRDEEDVKHAGAQHPSLLQDGLQRWDGDLFSGCHLSIPLFVQPIRQHRSASASCHGHVVPGEGGGPLINNSLYA